MRHLLIALILALPVLSHATTVEELSKSARTSLPAETYHLFADDYNLLGHLQFSKWTPLNERFFGKNPKLNGRPYRDFLLARINEILWRPDLNDKAVLGQFRANKMSLTPSYFQAPQAVRISILLHESAHANYPTHARCPVPLKDESGEDVVSVLTGEKLEGKFACAEKMDSYVIQIIFLDNIVKNCQNCNPQFKEVAQKQIANILPRIINQKLKEQLNAALRYQ